MYLRSEAIETPSVVIPKGFRVTHPDGCDRCRCQRGVILDRGYGAVLICAQCGQRMQSHGQWIYFVRAWTEEIKIGSAIDLVKRISMLQTGHPQHFDLAALLFGPRQLERNLHEKFDEFRLRGEWFWPAEELKQFMREECINVDAPFREFAAVVRGE